MSELGIITIAALVCASGSVIAALALAFKALSHTAEEQDQQRRFSETAFTYLRASTATEAAEAQNHRDYQQEAIRQAAVAFNASQVDQPDPFDQPLPDEQEHFAAGGVTYEVERDENGDATHLIDPHNNRKLALLEDL